MAHAARDAVSGATWANATRTLREHYLTACDRLPRIAGGTAATVSPAPGAPAALAEADVPAEPRGAG